MKFNSLLDLISKIDIKAKAIAYFVKMRWHNVIVCPYQNCVTNEFGEAVKIYKYSNGKDINVRQGDGLVYATKNKRSY